MAKIAKMPAMAVVNGFKGTLDFYVWKGILCVRAWPRSPGHARSPAVQDTWPAFKWASQNWQSLSAEVQDAYRSMVAGTNLTGRDMFVKSYITANHLNLP